MKIVEGNLEGKHNRFAIVVSQVHPEVTGSLTEGALACLKTYGVTDDSLLLVKVPGAWEIPIAIDRVAQSQAIDAVICLGAIVRDGLSHFEYLAEEVCKAISDSSKSAKKPVAFGVLITETEADALEMTGSGKANRGWQAAESALKMANLLDEIGVAEGSSFLQHLH